MQNQPIRERRNRHANLELVHFGLSDADLDTAFEAGQFLDLGKTSLKNILAHLQKCYTHHVGVELGAMRDGEKLKWLYQAFEKDILKPVALEQKNAFSRN